MHKIFRTTTVSLLSFSLTLGLFHTAHATASETWEVIIEDWGGYNNDCENEHDDDCSRTTPYDGDGNGSELYGTAIIKVDGVESTWAWNQCPNDCYNDQDPESWNNVRPMLRDKLLYRGETNPNPRIEVDLSIWENDDAWPTWTGNAENPSGGERLPQTLNQVAELGESSAIFLGPAAPYVAAASSVLDVITSLFKPGPNPDDHLWQFSRVFTKEGVQRHNFAVPGHQSTHWIEIRARKVR